MSLRETIERIRSSPTPPNEETAKIKILLPILNELSWDTNGQEVLWEHPVGGKKAGGKADIALQAEGHIRAIIEAKAPGTNLDHHVEQLLGYAFFEGVDICALSDGLRWWLYLPRERYEHEQRRFAELRLDDQGDPIEQICSDLGTFLGRESLLSGQAVKRATQVLKARQEAAQLGKEMPRIWQGMLDEPDSELIELFGERVYEKLSLRPSREQIIAAMRNTRIPPRPTETTKLHGSGPHERPAVQRKARRPVAVLLLGERHPVRSHVEVLTTVIGELHRRHPNDFDQATETLKAGEWQYVSRNRQRVYGKRVKQTAAGHFVNVNLSARNIRKRVVRLMEALGYRESDLKYLYE